MVSFKTKSSHCGVDALLAVFWLKTLLWDFAVLPVACLFRADLQHGERAVLELSDNF